ncbi:MAG: YihY family inner membrane protein, partial [Rhodospirillales bacterium]|nr:YihY family inner membrane protein [Rhodospirillales bacterium]
MSLPSANRILEAIIGTGRHAWRRFRAERGWRMAAGLSYTSLLAIVPLGAITFSMLAAFPVFEGMREQIQNLVFSNLMPQSADSMREQFDLFIANTSSLSAVGIIGIVATAILLFVTTEADFNVIFRVSKSRSLIPRLLVFWAMMTLGPVLVGTGLSLATYFFVASRWLGVDTIGGIVGWSFLGRIVSSLLMAAAFTIFYIVIPNRAVSIKAALVGGLSAGILFTVLRQLFGWYVATFPTYQSIYGALSVVPIFLIWMYLSWTVVLLGAFITTSVTEWRRAMRASEFANAAPDERLRVAVAILA